MNLFSQHEQKYQEEEKKEEVIDEPIIDSIHNLGWFIRNRKEQYEAAMEIRTALLSCKCIILSAEEKSGKRVIKEIVCMIGGRTEKHYYICALSRKDVITQLEELETYGLEALCVNRTRKALELVEKLRDQVEDSRIQKIILHVDECDYGSGESQSLSIIKYYCNNIDKIKLIYYSATPEEALNSSRFRDVDNTEYSLILFKPSIDYRGSEWFLDGNWTDESTEFFNYDNLLDDGILNFTRQGKEYLNYMFKYTSDNERNNKNFIGLLRLTGSTDGQSYYNKFKSHVYNLNIQNQAEKQKILGYLKFIKFIFINCDSSLKWDKERFVKDRLVRDKINIFVVNQTCSRSTELCGYFKNHQGFYHDYRRIVEEKSYNTLSQAYGRIKHYRYTIIGGEMKEVMWSGKIAIHKLIFEASCDPRKMNQIKRLAQRIRSAKEKEVVSNTSICSTKEEAERFINHYKRRHRRNNEQPRRYRFPRNFDEIHKVNNRYQAIIRSEKREYNLSEILNNKSYGINENCRFRIHPCYDETDDGRLYFVVCYFVKRIRTDTTRYTHATKQKSMYEYYGQ